MAEEEKEVQQEPKAGGKSKVLIFSGGGLAVLIGAAFLFATFAVPGPSGDGAKGGQGPGGDPAGVEQGADESLLIHDVPVIMVNLKDTNKKRVLKIHLNLVYTSGKPKAAEALLVEKGPEVKDALITWLTEKTPEELESKEDLNMLRTELKEELNRVIFSDQDGQIQKIYYQEFIIQ